MNVTLPNSAATPTPVRVALQAPNSGRWVPIRSLAPRHRDRIAGHLLALSVDDRYLRFGYPATDEQIGRYVEGLDFRRDELFGIVNRRLDLIAVAHVAYPPTPRIAGQTAMAEFGVSVLARVRGRGYGARLFAHAVLHTRNRGMQTLFIHALSENAPMLRIARAAGATLERDGSETEAWLKLPLQTLATQMGELMEQQVGEFDYRMKAQALRVSAFLDSWAGATQRPELPE